LICADGGLETAEKLNIIPDLAIGDSDSLRNIKRKNFIKFPVEKDKTDMELAVLEGLKRNFKEFVILGGLGGRFDHSYANLCILNFLSKNKIKSKMMDENNEMFIVRDDIEIFKENKKFLSIFPFACESCVVSSTGVKYQLLNTELKCNNTLGTSNEILQKKARITVHSGTALVIKC